MVQVHVAEFQSEPVKCTLSGSGFPGLARQQHLLGLTGSVHDPQPKWGKAEREHVVKPPGTGKGGAGEQQVFCKVLMYAYQHPCCKPRSIKLPSTQLTGDVHADAAAVAL